MKNLNQIVSSIITNQKSYQKAKERKEKAFDRALKWQTKKHERSLTKLSSRINKVSKFSKGGKNPLIDRLLKENPLICTHDHCLWWKREFAFENFKDSVKNPEKKKREKYTEDNYMV